MSVVSDERDEVEGDFASHMRKVTGYIRRHPAQGGPQEDVEHSRWRPNLMKIEIPTRHDPCAD